ncbi:hypothetical protein [Frankia sp. Cj5]|uniref:hypothetical protein n=1 Tax=Frankia sp. Cj5 TaxID=2880978 RepID=UPI001EF63D69|nr:hypothetical protein [Frankia sp. Cj5]
MTISEYVAVLVEIADDSGGGVVAPPRTVPDCRDDEDNLVLDLAAEVASSSSSRMTPT